MRIIVNLSMILFEIKKKKKKKIHVLCTFIRRFPRGKMSDEYIKAIKSTREVGIATEPQCLFGDNLIEKAASRTF